MGPVIVDTGSATSCVRWYLLQRLLTGKGSASDCRHRKCYFLCQMVLIITEAATGKGPVIVDKEVLLPVSDCS